MSGVKVVRRYARALYESSSESGKLTEAKSDMDFIGKLVSEVPEIRSFCMNQHSRNSEREFIDTAFRPYVSEATSRMMDVLCENGRLAAIPFLPEAFSSQEDIENGLTPLIIETANQLSEETVAEIEKKMSARIGSKIRSELRINKALIGGFRLTWQNRRIDMSLKGRLKTLKTLLK